jgi:membrane protease YdiL (CAAX protease family)
MVRPAARLFAGLVVVVLWYLVLAWGKSVAMPLVGPMLGNACGHAIGLVFALLAYALTRRWFGRVFSGWSWQLFGRGAACVLAIYFGAFAFRRFTGEPMEPYMATLYLNLSTVGVVAFFALVMVLAPMSEELVFRHFAFGALRLGPGAGWTLLAALLPALAFAFGHRQYVHFSTTLVLFGVALTCAMGRVASGGLLVPIALHALSGATALVLREVEIRL